MSTPPQVDFYLLAAPDPRARLTAACRLAEKAYEQGLKVVVRTASPAETAEFDELLWTFADRSFVPHVVWPERPGTGRGDAGAGRQQGPARHAIATC